MFKYNNNHIFTGYLKQLLSSVNIPTCKIYTRELADYLEQYGKEDPRIIESFGLLKDEQRAIYINYLKNNEIYNYYWKANSATPELSWQRTSSIYYDSSKNIPGLTKTLYSPGSTYDNVTHEYLGEYLRFLRDYYDINLMPLYNCFNDKICNNIFYKHEIKTLNPAYSSAKSSNKKNPEFKVESIRIFDSQDSNYKIYAIPVKLFAEYTIAVDSIQGIELFCGLYNTHLDESTKARDLIAKTYRKVNRTFFKQPFLYDSLNVSNWNIDRQNLKTDLSLESEQINRWDLASREQDLKLFIKVPVACKSSIVILEGNYLNFNDTRYAPVANTKTWKYEQNHAIINFDKNLAQQTNSGGFKPIGKLQLLAYNTNESYPFSNRLVEYLTGSAITSIDEISDNIKRAQRVMTQNQHYFKIDGLWENKMQKIIYDYLINSGPVEIDKEGKLKDTRQGYHRTLGHKSKSNLFDILGYVDKDAEKWYASWTKANDIQIKNTIQNVDIYIDENGKSLYEDF